MNIRNKSNFKLKLQRLSQVFLLCCFIFSLSSSAFSESLEKQKLFYDLFREGMNFIRSYFYDLKKVSYHNLTYGALQGMLESLDDDHCLFLNEKNYQHYLESKDKTLAGLGMQLAIQNGYPMVVSTKETSPAYRAGITSGDIIIELEGKATYEMNLYRVIRTLKGSTGTKIHFKIYRKDILEPLVFNLERAKISPPVLKSGFIKKGLAYIRIIQFNSATIKELKKTIADLQNNNMKSLIIDLRDNASGSLKIVPEMCDLFIDKGDMLTLLGKRSEKLKIYRANPDNTILKNNIALMVLVNKGTALGAEVFASAIKDSKRAKLIGDKTFGWAAGQKIIPINSAGGKIAVKLSVNQFITNAKKIIHGKGIQPDIQVRSAKKDYEVHYMEVKLSQSNEVKQFLIKSPNYSNKQLNRLIKKLSKKGMILKKSVVKRYLSSEKIRQGISLFDSKLDLQLKKAVSLLK